MCHLKPLFRSGVLSVIMLFTSLQGSVSFAESTTHPFRYVFMGTSNTCELAVAQAAALVNGGSESVSENELATSQLFSGVAAPAFCTSVLPGSTPTPAVIGEQGWVPSGAGLLPNAANGDDPRCSMTDEGEYTTSQIVNGICSTPETAN